MLAVRRTSVVVAIALGWWAAPAVASAAPVQCGQVLSHTTVMGNDLVDCPGPGLVAGADGITIDLGGHTITAALEEQADAADGVSTNGHAGVRVVNGTVVGFSCGVRLSGDAGVAQGMTVRFSDPWRGFPGPGAAGVCVRGDGNQVVDNQVRDVVSAISIEAGTGTVVRGNDTGTSYIVGADFEPGADFRGTRVVGNRAGGIYLEPGRGGVISGNLAGDVQVGHGDSSTLVTRNELNGYGISLERSQITSPAGGVRVTDNRLTGEFRSGGIVSSRVEFDPGVDPDGVLGDRIIGNVVHNSVAGVSLYQAPSVVRDNVLGQSAPNAGGSGGNEIGIGVYQSPGTLVLRNRLYGNIRDGVEVDERSAGVVLRENLAARNGGDGFEVSAPTAQLRGNAAFRNGEWGIFAVDGVRGSGNRASGNLIGQCDPARLC